MSNVLIGIIGVILFIGLALAGALFLGPRFQQATNDSKASAMVQALGQVSHAVNLFEIQEGTSMSDGAVSALTPQYLKTMPTNPAWLSAPAIATNGSIRYVYVTVGPDDRVCKVINLRNQGEEAVPQFSQSVLKSTSGCYMTGSFLVAFARI